MVSFKIGNLRKSLANRGKNALLDNNRQGEYMTKRRGQRDCRSGVEWEGGQERS